MPPRSECLVLRPLSTRSWSFIKIRSHLTGLLVEIWRKTVSPTVWELDVSLRRLVCNHVSGKAYEPERTNGICRWWRTGSAILVRSLPTECLRRAHRFMLNGGRGGMVRRLDVCRTTLTRRCCCGSWSCFCCFDSDINAAAICSRWQRHPSAAESLLITSAPQKEKAMSSLLFLCLSALIYSQSHEQISIKFFGKVGQPQWRRFLLYSGGTTWRARSAKLYR